MCEPTTLMAGMSLAMGVMGGAQSIQAGGAANKAKKLEAFNYETQRKEVATQASASQRDRFEEFAQAEAANVLAAALSNQSLASFDTMFAENRAKAGEDVTRIADQGRIQDSRLRFAAANARAEGQAAKTAGMWQGLSTIGQSLMSFGMNIEQPTSKVRTSRGRH